MTSGPSWRSRFEPQVSSRPSLRMATECDVPATICPGLASVAQPSPGPPDQAGLGAGVLAPAVTAARRGDAQAVLVTGADRAPQRRSDLDRGVAVGGGTVAKLPLVVQPPGPHRAVVANGHHVGRTGG